MANRPRRTAQTPKQSVCLPKRRGVKSITYVCYIKIKRIVLSISVLPYERVDDKIESYRQYLGNLRVCRAIISICRTTMAQTQHILLKAERHFRFCKISGILATPVAPFAPIRGCK